VKVGDLVTATFRLYESQGFTLCKRQGVILSLVEKTVLPRWLTNGKQTYMVYCVDTPLKIYELRERDLKLLSEAK